MWRKPFSSLQTIWTRKTKHSNQHCSNTNQQPLKFNNSHHYKYEKQHSRPAAIMNDLKNLCENSSTPVLTEEQIEKFQHDGILVVDNILTDDELETAKEGLHQSLLRYGIDTSNLADTAHNLKNLSSTGGSGGVLDLFYSKFKMDIALNERLFHATTELWRAAYCRIGESEEDMRLLGSPERFHPFGKFDANKGYAYIDRLGYRIPSVMAEEIGSKLQEQDEDELKNVKTKKSKRKKNMAIQRSLTPHLDCCPDSFNSINTSKWRPIQCFVSLTDNTTANTGGFEALPGFHRNFHQWAKERIPSTITKRDPKSGAKTKVQVPPPCIGEYTHIRPKEDEDVMKAVRHIPVRAGSAVFWDNRIPHANAYKNESDCARAVVYCSYLPDVEVNRAYVKEQLEDYTNGRNPRDQWINPGDARANRASEEKYEAHEFSEIGRKLMNIDEW